MEKSIKYKVSKKNESRNMVAWILGIIMAIIGILNILHIGIIPGLFYALVAILFIPPGSNYLKQTLKVSITFKLKLVLFFLILWATLGVGDLAEFYGL